MCTHMIAHLLQSIGSNRVDLNIYIFFFSLLVCPSKFLHRKTWRTDPIQHKIWLNLSSTWDDVENSRIGIRFDNSE